MGNSGIILKKLGVFAVVAFISTIAFGGIVWVLHPICGLSCADFIISSIYASPLFGIPVGIFAATQVKFHQNPTKSKSKRKEPHVTDSRMNEQIMYVLIGFFCIVLLTYVGAIIRNHHLVNQVDTIRADIEDNSLLRANNTTQDDVENLLSQAPYRMLTCRTAQHVERQDITILCHTPTMLRRISRFLPVESHGSDYGYYTVVFTFEDSRLQDVAMRGWLCGMGTDVC